MSSHPAASGQRTVEEAVQAARACLDDVTAQLGAEKAAREVVLTARTAALARDNAALDARCADLEERNTLLEAQLQSAEARRAAATAETRTVRSKLDEVVDGVEGKREALRCEREMWKESSKKYRKRCEHAEQALQRVKSRSVAGSGGGGGGGGGRVSIAGTSSGALQLGSAADADAIAAAAAATATPAAAAVAAAAAAATTETPLPQRHHHHRPGSGELQVHTQCDNVVGVVSSVKAPGPTRGAPALSLSLPSKRTSPAARKRARLHSVRDNDRVGGESGGGDRLDATRSSLPPHLGPANTIAATGARAERAMDVDDVREDNHNHEHEQARISKCGTGNGSDGLAGEMPTMGVWLAPEAVVVGQPMPDGGGKWRQTRATGAAHRDPLVFGRDPDHDDRSPLSVRAATASTAWQLENQLWGASGDTPRPGRRTNDGNFDSRPQQEGAGGAGGVGVSAKRAGDMFADEDREIFRIVPQRGLNAAAAAAAAAVPCVADGRGGGGGNDCPSNGGDSGGATTGRDRIPLSPALAPAPAARRPSGPPGGTKYVEVVRRKADRAALPSFTCEECDSFYAAAERTGVQRPQGACTHCPGLGDRSRHRAKWAPPPAPVGYWNLGFGTQQSTDTR